MDLSKDLASEIELLWEDEEWLQAIDYEQIPFRCRKCHKNDHLVRNCPLNITSELRSEGVEKDQEGFTKVTNRRRPMRRGMGPSIQSKNLPNSKPTTLVPTDPLSKEEVTASPNLPSSIIETRISEILPQEGSPTTLNGVDNLMQEDINEEIPLGELDLEGLEVACTMNIPESIPP